MGDHRSKMQLADEADELVQKLLTLAAKRALLARSVEEADSEDSELQWKLKDAIGFLSGRLVRREDLAKKRRREPLGVGFAVKVWPVEDDGRWSWLTKNGGWMISPYERGVWDSRADAKAEARKVSMRSRLVRIRFRRLHPISTRQGEP
jgi:hypothetical protein